MKRGTPEKIETKFGDFAPYVLQQVGPEWCVFHEEKTRDGVEFWGAIIVAPTRADALARFYSAVAAEQGADVMTDEYEVMQS